MQQYLTYIRKIFSASVSAAVPARSQQMTAALKFIIKQVVRCIHPHSCGTHFDALLLKILFS
jgi:hypothetical protein